MTVGSSYAITMAALSDCLKNVAHFFKPIGSKTKSNHAL